MTKVFRVLIGEQQGFYVDIEAPTPNAAMENVRSRLNDPNDNITPIEDNSSYEGYQVEDAIEIQREDANLE